MGDQEGFRLKTIKLRGQISQGLILPYNVIPIAQFASAYDLPEGMDVSEMLGIVKYEPPIPAHLVNRFATPQDYDNWTSKRYHEWHSTGGNIDLPPIIQG